MAEFLHLGLLGLGAGALIALSALGLVLVYRSSGVVNFAHGAAGVVGAFAYWDLTVNAGWAPAPAVVAGTLAAAVLGVATYALVMVAPRGSGSTLTRTIATLAVLIVVQSAALLRYGQVPEQVQPFLPDGIVDLGGGITVSADRLILLGVAVALALGLGELYRRTRFGLATTAVSERPRHLAALGWRIGLLRAGNWALGGALGGLAGVLIAPITGVAPGNGLLLIVNVLAAALIGGLSSFRLTLAGGLLIGVLQAELAQHDFGVSGLADAVPFLAIVAVLALRGGVLPLRGFVGERLPRVASGRIRPAWAVAGAALLAGAIGLAGDAGASAITTSLLAGIVILSLVVVLGYAGQLSLAQVTLSGVGALLAARLARDLGVPFLLALPLAALGTVPVGLLVGLPSVRTRGVSLAIATLGMAVAVQALVFDNTAISGGQDGIVISATGELVVLGVELDSFFHPHRYALLVLGVLLMLALLVANLRRGRAGRRLVAVRSNERAAAALGVDVAGAKLWAFALGAAIAGVAGALVAYRNPAAVFDQFGVLGNVTVVAYAVVGGVGGALGAVVGGLLQTGGVASWLLGELSSGWARWVDLIGGVMLLATVTWYPDGVVAGVGRGVAEVRGLVARAPRRAAEPVGEGAAHRVAPATLTLRDVDVRFGGVHAVDRVSLTVAPGEVVAVIGPNGAGKTTLIDAITGFAPATGAIQLGARELSGRPPHRRAAAGLARSWQTLELFEDLTVRENLRVAGDPRDAAAYLVDLVRPRRGGLTPAALGAVATFELAADLDASPARLSTGRRKLVALARAIADAPSVLALDEPCAGLDEHERAEVASAIRALADEWGMGVLLVEHDVDLVRRVSDRVLVLDFGAVIAQGPADAVLADERVTAAYLGTVQGAATGSRRAVATPATTAPGATAAPAPTTTEETP